MERGRPGRGQSQAGCSREGLLGWLSYSQTRSCAGEREETARWAQLDFIVKALAPLWGFRQRGGRGLSRWVKERLGPLQLRRLRYETPGTEEHGRGRKVPVSVASRSLTGLVSFLTST